MSKIREFFADLRKSTKITLISCGSFIVMTFVILCFFIMSPITPADKAGSTFGRESISPDGSTVNSIVTTIDENGNSIEVSRGTTNTASTASTVTTTKKEYKITVTTGTGHYNVDGKIIIGDYEGYNYNTTTTAYGGYSGESYTTTQAYSGGGVYTTQAGGNEQPTTVPEYGGDEPPTIPDVPDVPTPTVPEPTQPVAPVDVPDVGNNPAPGEGSGESSGE